MLMNYYLLRARKHEIEPEEATYDPTSYSGEHKSTESTYSNSFVLQPWKGGIMGTVTPGVKLCRVDEWGTANRR